MHGPKIVRDWGNHRILEDQPQYKIKELVLLPGKSLPTKQYPMNKHWFVLQGECIIETVYLESPQTIHVAQAHSYCIGAGVWHLAKNTSDGECHILEVRYLAD
jgi:mannose-6-phosphate isomerase-like protein (cupin superfamily)